MTGRLIMMHFQNCVNGMSCNDVRLDDVKNGFLNSGGYRVSNRGEIYKNTKSGFAEVLGFMKNTWKLVLIVGKCNFG